MGIAWTHEPQAAMIAEFFRLLAVCHTIIPEGVPEEDQIKYAAESPDEAALVVAAKVFGFFFYKRSNNAIWVKETTETGAHEVVYEILNILEFNSTRKRMSVICKGPDGNIKLLCKGADTVIFERLDSNYPPNLEMKTATTRHLENFGSAGLRTLCLAVASIDPEFYPKWNEEYHAAKTALQNREERLDAVAEQIECNLHLLGCTAIEDKLQEGVPQCIAKLMAAGVRIWVLTGDKMETAINIGFACSLISEEMLQFRVNANLAEVEKLQQEGRCAEATQLALKMLESQMNQALVAIQNEKGNSKCALIIDGQALVLALTPHLSGLLLQVGLLCDAVICCRVSPLQKALVTALVKSHGVTTLAIGDGANDVGMIQKADIGVGISGQEGRQAVMCSDFAIAQFRYLEFLLLVHGRWSYKRICRMVLFFFYKNLLFGSTLFVFNALAAFSGQYIYDDFYMTLFNVVFTSLTPIVMGIFDQDVSKEVALKNPSLYKEGQENRCINLWQISSWLGTAWMHCAFIMAMVMIGCDPINARGVNGVTWGLWDTGVVMFTCVVGTVHLLAATVFENWTIAHHVAIWGSYAIWLLYLVCYGYFPLSISASLFHLFVESIAALPYYWLIIFVVPAACVLPNVFVRFVRRLFAPSAAEILGRESKKQRGLKRTASGRLLQNEEQSLLGAISAKAKRNSNTSVSRKPWEKEVALTDVQHFIPPGVWQEASLDASQLIGQAQSDPSTKSAVRWSKELVQQQVEAIVESASSASNEAPDFYTAPLIRPHHWKSEADHVPP